MMLRPPSGAFLDRLFELACTGEIPWNWNDRRETPEGFRQSLHDHLLVMFSAVDRRTGREVGFLAAHEYRPLHRFAYVSMTFLPDVRRRGWPLEAAVLFVDHLFVRFDLRHLYFRIVEHEFAAVRSGAGRFFDVEGRLRDQLVVNGQTQDLYIATVSASRWQDDGRRLLDRIVGSNRSETGGHLPPTLVSTRAALVDALRAVMDLDGEPVGDDTNLVDLGFDSLDLASVLVEIEDRIGSDVPSDVLDEIAELGDAMTVGAVTELIHRWNCASTRDAGAAMEPVVVDAVPTRGA